MAEHTAPAGPLASAAELWAALRDAGPPRTRTGLGRMRPGLPRGLVTGLGLAILAAVASAALMGLAGWLIVRSAQTGLSAKSAFSWIYPSAGVEALAVVRTAARYGERLTTHRVTLEMLARLRARVFASATRMAPRQLSRFHSGDLLDRVQADIDSLDRVMLAVAVPGVVCAIVGAAGLAVLTRARRGGGRRPRGQPPEPPGGCGAGPGPGGRAGPAGGGAGRPDGTRHLRGRPARAGRTA